MARFKSQDKTRSTTIQSITSLCRRRLSALVEAGLARNSAEAAGKLEMQAACALAQALGRRPPRRIITVMCLGCRAKLYRYRKGGKGGLRKCYVERIVRDNTAGDGVCPACGSRFAHPTVIRGQPAHRIVSARVYTRG